MKGESLVQVAADKALRTENIFPSASGKTCHPATGPATDGKGISTMSGGPTIFTVQSKMLLERRLDPEYHFARLNTSVKSPYPLVKLLSLAHFKTGGTPSTGIADYWGGSLPWVSAKDFKTFRFEDSEDHITEKAAREATTYVVDKPALLMVSRSGILQHSLPVMVTYKRTAINQDIKAFFPDNRATVDYLGAYFGLMGPRLLPLLCKSGATVQSLNTNELLNLQIPVPSLDVQKRIVEGLDAAYAAKRKADENAARLLSSIDDIVLSELGIPPLPPQDDSLAARMFTVPARQLAEKTLAPSHYFECLDFSASRFPCRRFSDVVAIDPAETNSGALGRCSFVPMDAVSAEYGRIEHFETVEADRTNGYSCFRNGDVIWAKITPCMENGKSAVVESSDTGLLFGSTEFMVFRPRSTDIDPRYLHCLLRLRRLRQVAARHFTGSSGHQRVTGAFFAGLEIPVPPHSVQCRIVGKVTTMREDAKSLKSAAALTLSSTMVSIEDQMVGRKSKHPCI